MTAIELVSQPRKRILYIEGHEDSREVLTTMLGQAGYDVATATTLADGTRLDTQGPFDLYILESRFPDGTGVDLCRQLRAYHPRTPIIFYSADGYASDIEAGLAAGAQRYLVKPSGVYDLEQTIAGLFAASAASLATLSGHRSKPAS